MVRSKEILLKRLREIDRLGEKLRGNPVVTGKILINYLKHTNKLILINNYQFYLAIFCECIGSKRLGRLALCS